MININNYNTNNGKKIGKNNYRFNGYERATIYDIANGTNISAINNNNINYIINNITHSMIIMVQMVQREHKVIIMTMQCNVKNFSNVNNNEKYCGSEKDDS